VPLLHFSRSPPQSWKRDQFEPWVEYLFLVTNEPIKNIQALISERKNAKAMKAGNHEDVVLEEDDGEYERGDVFLSFPLPGFKTDLLASAIG